MKIDLDRGQRSLWPVTEAAIFKCAERVFCSEMSHYEADYETLQVLCGAAVTDYYGRLKLKPR